MMNNSTKVVVIGAAGNLGCRLVARGLAQGHDVKAFVWSRRRLAERWERGVPEGLKIVEGDIFDERALASAIAGQTAVVNAAGHATEGEKFVELFRTVLAAAERHLLAPRRLWMVAGAAALNIPHTGRVGVDLPGVPHIYRSHVANWRQLEASDTDWSLMCPGPMVAAADGLPRKDLRISTDVLPREVGTWARWAPSIALSLLMKARLPQLVVSYEDVAEVMMANLSSNGPFSRQRVGVALPAGERGRKDDWTPGQRGPDV